MGETGGGRVREGETEGGRERGREGGDNIKYQLQNATDHKVMAPKVCSLISFACSLSSNPLA